MEAEFVAKSAALVGRMTVAAAQANLHELRSELETLQDFAHMLRAQRLTRALAELARTVEELHISEARWQPSDLAPQLAVVDRAAAMVRAYILKAGKAGSSAAEQSQHQIAISSGASPELMPPPPPPGSVRPSDQAEESARLSIPGGGAVGGAPSGGGGDGGASGDATPHGGAAGGSSCNGGGAFGGGGGSGDATPHGGGGEVGTSGSVRSRVRALASSNHGSTAASPRAATAGSSANAAAAAPQNGGGGGGSSSCGGGGGGCSSGGGSSGGGGGVGGGGGSIGGGGGSRLPESLLHQKALSGPISGFVQRGELMVERMQAQLEAGNLKGVRREALRMKATAAQLDNRRRP